METWSQNPIRLIGMEMVAADEYAYIIPIPTMQMGTWSQRV